MHRITEELENELRAKLAPLDSRSKQNSTMYLFCKENELNYVATENCVQDCLLPYTQVEKVKRFYKKFSNAYRADSLILALEYFLYYKPDIEVIDYIRCVSSEMAIPLSREYLDTLIGYSRQIVELLETIKDLTPEEAQDVPRDWKSFVKENQ